MLPHRSLLALTLALTLHCACAQFVPGFIQNGSYWNDGKAEFNIYGGEVVREGAPRTCEVLHILVREPFDPNQLVKPNDPNQPGAMPVLKLNQVLSVPTGLYLWGQQHSNFWRVDDAQLIKFSLTSGDSCGNTFKLAKRNGDTLSYEYHTYWDGMADGKLDLPMPADAHFYDELPLLVRTIDFAKPSGEFETQLAGNVMGSKKDNIAFKPAKVSWTSNERNIDVTVAHAGGTDQFTLDRHFPFVLREWKAADGSHLKLKRNLKVDYWNYSKPGDRERALNNPMLRLPD